MDIKLFEIRDCATFIPAMAVRLRNRTPDEFFLLRRAGYGKAEIGGPEETPGTLADGLQPYVIFVKLDGVEAQYDPFSWAGGARTMRVAHHHVIEHWGSLVSGQVIDVQFILGETNTPKASEAEGGAVT